MTADPAALFRTMLAEWEKMTNNVGGDYLRSDDWTRFMHGGQTATLQLQEATKAAMERALAAANMPSREEVANLSDRLGRIEAQLARIEAAVGAVPTAPARPKPTRTRKPPEPKIAG